MVYFHLSINVWISSLVFLILDLGWLGANWVFSVTWQTTWSWEWQLNNAQNAAKWGKTHWNKQNAMWGTLLTCLNACSWLQSLGCEKLLPCAAWLVQNWSRRRHLVASPKVLCQMAWALGWSRSGKHHQATLGKTQQEATGSWSAIQKQVIYTGI